MRAQASKQLARFLAGQLDGISIPNNPTNRVAAACFQVALDHHAAIALLFENGLSSPALALLRPLFEAFIRGAWLYHCADDKHVEAFAKGGEPPKIATMIAQLERTEGFDSGVLSKVKQANWVILNALTHTGMVQVATYLSDEAIEHNFNSEQRDEALRNADALALLSAVQTSVIADDDDLARRLFAEMTRAVAAEE